MELRHLQYFVAVAESGGFGRAARLLHISQSAISEQIRGLEDEIGAQLLDRSHRQIRLTNVGELFLRGAKSTLAAAEDAVASARRAQKGEQGRLAIGFFVGGNGRFFPRLIRAFREKYPDIEVSLVEMVPAQQWIALQNGTLDIGFTRPLQTQWTGSVRTEKFASERMYGVFPKNHPLAKKREIATALLHGERFVLPERQTSPAVFDRIVSLCSEAGFSPNVVSTASVSAGVLALVEAGDGISILPEGARLLGGGEVVFVPIAGASAQVELVIAWSGDRVSAVHRNFLQLARTFRDT